MTKGKKWGVYAINVILFLALIYVAKYTPYDWQASICLSVLVYSLLMMALKNVSSIPLVVSSTCVLLFGVEFMDIWSHGILSPDSYMLDLLKYEAFVLLTGIIFSWLLYYVFKKEYKYSIIALIIFIIMLYIFHSNAFFRYMVLP